MKRLALLAVPLALLLVTACKPVQGGVSGGAAVVTIPVYTGPGDPPSEAGAGSWLRVWGDDTSPAWAWLSTAAAGAAGAIGGWSLAQMQKQAAGKAGIGPTAVRMNNPCPEGQPRNYKVARWRIFAKPNNKGPIAPYMDCQGFRKIVKDHGWPARVRFLYDCIANILENGTMSHGAWGGGNRTYFGWGWQQAYVTARDDGRLLEVYPGPGGWGACARGTP